MLIIHGLPIMIAKFWTKDYNFWKFDFGEIKSQQTRNTLCSITKIHQVWFFSVILLISPFYWLFFLWCHAMIFWREPIKFENPSLTNEMRNLTNSTEVNYSVFRNPFDAHVITKFFEFSVPETFFLFSILFTKNYM